MIIVADRAKELDEHVDGDFSLALVRYRPADDAGDLFARGAASVRMAGHLVRGILQISRQRPDRRKCDNFLRDLSTAEEVCI